MRVGTREVQKVLFSHHNNKTIYGQGWRGPTRAGLLILDGGKDKLAKRENIFSSAGIMRCWGEMETEEISKALINYKLKLNFESFFAPELDLGNGCFTFYGQKS
jgi:hypothetical protein